MTTNSRIERRLQVTLESGQILRHAGAAICIRSGGRRRDAISS